MAAARALASNFNFVRHCQTRTTLCLSLTTLCLTPCHEPGLSLSVLYQMNVTIRRFSDLQIPKNENTIQIEEDQRIGLWSILNTCSIQNGNLNLVMLGMMCAV